MKRLAVNRLVGALFGLFLLCAQSAWAFAVPKTGQTVSYQNGDDGYYNAGASRSFTRDSVNNIVTDNVTGLMWQDDNGTNTLKTIEEAQQSCSSLTLGGYTDWRLPVITELTTLIDFSNYTNNMVLSVFKNGMGGGNTYWSQTKADSQHTYQVQYLPTVYIDAYYNNKGAARCTRGEVKNYSQIYKVYNDFVADTSTKLMWQKTKLTTSSMAWYDAVQYCENLQLGGYSDWKLPNLFEFLSIVNPTGSGNTAVVTSSELNYIKSSRYWTSTSFNQAGKPYESIGYTEEYKDFAYYIDYPFPHAQGIGSIDYNAKSKGNQNVVCTRSYDSLPSNQAPTAAFSANSTAGVNTTVSFTNNSFDTDGNITAYSWSFGDGTTSADKNPTHKYTSVGKFTVTLTVTDNSGASSANVTQSIIVQNLTAPTADFTATPTSGTAPLSVSFANNSTAAFGSIVSTNWSFGDGKTSMTTNPIWVYQNPGTYTATLKVTDDSGNVSPEKNVTITVKEISYYTLNVGADSTGYGYVSASPYVSSYGGTSFKEGATVTVTATPASSKYEFTGWSGDASGTTNPLTVTMDKAKTITANFGKAAIYKLTVNTPTNGTITVTPQKDKYADGDKVTLEAVPASGYKWDSWSGISFGYGQANYKVSLTMSADATVGANFVYDATPPVVTLVAPVSNTTIGDTFKVIATATSSDPAYLPDLYIDGSFYAKMTLSGTNFIYMLDTTQLANGSHSLQVKTKSVNGVKGGSSYVSFTVDNASTTQAPKVTILDPQNNDTLTETATITASIRNIDQLKKAVLYVDGKAYGRVLTAAPWSFTFATKALANGSHTLKIVAQTTGGKLYESNIVTVSTNNTVWSDNVAVNILSPASGATKGAKFSVQVGTSSGESVTRTDLYLDGSDIWFATAQNSDTVAVDLSAYTDGEHTLKAYVETDGGNVGYSTSVSFTLKNSCADGTNCGSGTPLSVVSGWNLKASPIKGADISVAAFKASSLVKALWIYDTTTGAYKGYTKSGTNDITTIPNGSGFWISATADGTVNTTSTMPPAPTVQQVVYKKGWNLLATPSGSLSTGFFKPCTDVYSMYAYRGAAYSAYKTSDNTDTIETLDPTEGFWLYASKDGYCGDAVQYDAVTGTQISAVPVEQATSANIVGTYESFDTTRSSSKYYSMISFNTDGTCKITEWLNGTRRATTSTPPAAPTTTSSTGTNCAWSYATAKSKLSITYNSGAFDSVTLAGSTSHFFAKGTWSSGAISKTEFLKKSTSSSLTHSFSPSK